MLEGPQGPRMTEEKREQQGAPPGCHVSACVRARSVILTLDLHPAVRLHLLTPSIYLRPGCRCALHSSASPSCIQLFVSGPGVALHWPAPDPGSARRPECIVLSSPLQSGCPQPRVRTTTAPSLPWLSFSTVVPRCRVSPRLCFVFFCLLFLTPFLSFFYKQYFHFLSLGVARCVAGHRVQCQLLPVLSVAGVEGQ